MAIDGNWFHAAGADTAKDRRPKFVDVETAVCAVCACFSLCLENEMHVPGYQSNQTSTAQHRLCV